MINIQQSEALDKIKKSLECAVGGIIEFVEKRKISYFGLARNLSRHLISPNQDDLSYSARTFISGLQNG